jgi:hypothetical protein
MTRKAVTIAVRTAYDHQRFCSWFPIGRPIYEVFPAVLSVTAYVGSGNFGSDEGLWQECPGDT